MVKNTSLWHKKFLITRSNLAGLAFEIPTIREYMSDFSSDNQTLADDLWEALDTNPTAVALKDEYAKKIGLDLEVRFPWDDEMSVYSIQAFHQIHCLVS